MCSGPEEGHGVRLMKFEVVEVLEVQVVQVKTRNVSRYVMVCFRTGQRPPAKTSHFTRFQTRS